MGWMTVGPGFISWQG